MSRSDVNIIAVINPKTHKVLLVNTPRDYYVQLHGTTGVRDKLTHAGIYGIDMSRQTLEDLYGAPINYSVRINFTSLLKIIDAVGSVDVTSRYSFRWASILSSRESIRSMPNKRWLFHASATTLLMAIGRAAKPAAGDRSHNKQGQ
ncbi:LCP family protein [Candidatus Saccharibacteria bacterium]|nr:MAG: LCP family protein [Candidatus Saccharibacteria bacterium]